MRSDQRDLAAREGREGDEDVVRSLGGGDLGVHELRDDQDHETPEEDRDHAQVGQVAQVGLYGDAHQEDRDEQCLEGDEQVLDAQVLLVAVVVAELLEVHFRQGDAAAVGPHELGEAREVREDRVAGAVHDHQHELHLSPLVEVGEEVAHPVARLVRDPDRDEHERDGLEEDGHAGPEDDPARHGRSAEHRDEHQDDDVVEGRHVDAELRLGPRHGLLRRDDHLGHPHGGRREDAAHEERREQVGAHGHGEPHDAQHGEDDADDGVRPRPGDVPFHLHEDRFDGGLYEEDDHTPVGRLLDEGVDGTVVDDPSQGREEVRHVADQEPHDQVARELPDAGLGEVACDERHERDHRQDEE